MASEGLIQIAPLDGNPFAAKPAAERPVEPGVGKICGIDVGSTTCKYTLASPTGEVLAQAYERHNTKQAEKVLDFLNRLEQQNGLTPEKDRVFFTGSGAG
jgi:activator of 2-hydroxyglutaryl-CoA dehydratase